jgi:hypothetical protein
MKGLGSLDWSKALSHTKLEEQEKKLEEKAPQISTQNPQQQPQPLVQKRESNFVYRSPFKNNVGFTFRF